MKKKIKTPTVLSVLQSIDKKLDVIIKLNSPVIIDGISADITPKPAWKTIKIGGKTKEELLKDIQVSSYAKSMVDTITLPTEVQEASFSIKTPRELGFTESPTFRQFIDFLKAHKEYDICKPEDALFLRKEYTEQPKYEWIRCAMETIPDSDGDPSVFRLVHDDSGVWLDRDWYNDGRRLDLDNRWVVRIRK